MNGNGHVGIGDAIVEPPHRRRIGRGAVPCLPEFAATGRALIGKSSQEITYMLAWDSMAEREKRWGAFLADPEWVAVVAKTEKDGQLVGNISSQLLAPAAFSAVK